MQTNLEVIPVASSIATTNSKQAPIKAKRSLLDK
jgi:hypothetical protein